MADVIWATRQAGSSLVLGGYEEVVLEDVYNGVAGQCSCAVEYAQDVDRDLASTVEFASDWRSKTVAGMLDQVALATNTTWSIGPQVIYVGQAGVSVLGPHVDVEYTVVISASSRDEQLFGKLSINGLRWRLQREAEIYSSREAHFVILDSRRLRVTTSVDTHLSLLDAIDTLGRE